MNPKAHSTIKRKVSPPRHTSRVGVVGTDVMRGAKRVYRSTLIHCRAVLFSNLPGKDRDFNMYDIMAAYVGIIIAFALTLFFL